MTTDRDILAELPERLAPVLALFEQPPTALSERLLPDVIRALFHSHAAR